MKKEVGECVVNDHRASGKSVWFMYLIKLYLIILLGSKIIE